MKKKLISGSNHQSTKIANRALALKMICTGSHISRIDIARRTGLSKMALTNIVGELIEEGFVIEMSEIQEASPGNRSSGRKPVFLDVDTSKYFVLGLYISRDYINATLTNLKCENLIEEKINFTDIETEKTFINKIKSLLHIILSSDKTSGKVILGIGVACIGPLDAENGIILEPHNFYNLGIINIKQLIENEFGYKVFINNDMKASALAEKLYGKGKSISNFVYVGVTNGIGAGIIANDSLFMGERGFSGEIGHATINFSGPVCKCGNNGCLELYASIPEIVHSAERLLSEGYESKMNSATSLSWFDIVKYAYENDKLALELIDNMCNHISFGIVSLINIYDPAIIFLGHDIAIAGNLVAKKIETNIKERIFSRKYKSVPVAISAFEDKTPIAGAASIVLDKLFNGELE